MPIGIYLKLAQMQITLDCLIQMNSLQECIVLIKISERYQVKKTVPRYRQRRTAIRDCRLVFENSVDISVSKNIYESQYKTPIDSK